MHLFARQPDDSLEHAYREALAWLFSFINTEHHPRAALEDFFLPRTIALMQMLGNPQTRYPSVVIAGTNGKGSTAAMTESILRAAGLRTGLYTSPALHDPREVIQMNRQPISKETLIALVKRLQPVVAQGDPALSHLSTYELMTALALLFFATEHVDVAILEIGLGGRCDAVNVVTPTVSAITSISLDHTAMLGSTREAIAREKAGIIKAHVPIVTVPQQPEVIAVLDGVARRQDAPLFLADETGLHRVAPPLLPVPSEEGQPFPVAITPASVALRGTFQLENARLAVGIGMLLAEAGFILPPQALKHGLETVSWPARVEVLQQEPLVIVDGAHNGDAAWKLGATLQQCFRYERLLLVLGLSADKDPASILEPLGAAADSIILTRSPHPRAALVEPLRAAVAPFVRGDVLSTSTVAEAVSTALRLAHPTDLICITGSLFVAAAARELFGRGAHASEATER